MSKRFFKKLVAPEAGLGDGLVYFEYDGDIPTRQVELYDGRWFDSRTAYHEELGPGLVDQPRAAVGLTVDDEISADEFEAAWSASVRAKP
jgi:hypothetical protein